MESESQTNDENNEVKSKRERIKQRLKEMGVSVDSERPQESWLSKYGKYFLVVIFLGLLVAYWLEYKNQDSSSEQKIAQNEPSAAQNQNLSPYYSNGQPRQMAPSNNQQSAWQQRNAMHQKRQHEMWQQQKMRQQAWQKQMREQQEKNRQAWEQYIRQQQENNAYYGNNFQQNQPPSYYSQPYPNQSYYNGWQR